MPIFAPSSAFVKQAVAHITGQSVAVVSNADVSAWAPPSVMNVVNSTGIGIGVSGFDVVIGAGFDWFGYTMKAGFGVAVDNTDNGIGYRAATIDQLGAGGRILAVSTTVGVFTGFNASVVSVSGGGFLNGVSGLLSPGFQHTATVNLNVYFEIQIRIYAR